MTDLQPESSVSYVATVYNKKSFLEQVLGAIEAEWQDTGGEIILVDDGSTDGSLELLNDFKGGRDNIVVHTGPNRGPAAATNIGFNGASCRYLRFVDGDEPLVSFVPKQAEESIKKGELQLGLYKPIPLWF